MKRRMNLSNRMSGVVLVGSAAMLAACGGGGGGGIPGDINGTGASNKVFVRGPINAFGSVVVNGRRFETDGATVESRDALAALGDLRVGQIVSVEGRRETGGSFSAERIRYDADIVGPIAAIDTDAGTITVLGQTVRVVGATVFDNVAFESLAVGNVVEISGARIGDGVFTASYVEREDDGEVELVGVIGDLNTAAQTFRIGQITVDYSGVSGDDLEDVIAGAVVEVEGELSGSLLIADEIEREDDDLGDFLETGAEIEISGTVDALLASDRFLLRGFTVVFDSGTEFDDGNASNLAVGTRVEVEGRIDASGLLRAEEIEFEDDDSFETVEIEARVQSVNPPSLGVLGIIVDTDAFTRVSDDKNDQQPFGIEDLVVGDYVEIAALPGAARLLAIRVEREEDDDDDELEGFVDSFNGAAGTAVVSGVSVDMNGAEFEEGSLTRDGFFAQLVVGDRLEIEGLFNGNALIADEVEFDDDDDDDDDDL